MADDLHEGDYVSWNSHGETADGTVQRTITKGTQAAGQTVRASEVTGSTR